MNIKVSVNDETTQHPYIRGKEKTGTVFFSKLSKEREEMSKTHVYLKVTSFKQETQGRERENGLEIFEAKAFLSNIQIIIKQENMFDIVKIQKIKRLVIM